MSNIDIDKFESWLESRSTVIGTVKRCGSGKYLLNSVFKQDKNFHLGLFPLRGKYGRFNDYKSDKRGTIVEFITIVDGVSKEEAIRKVSNNRPVQVIQNEIKPISLSSINGAKLPIGCVGFDEECNHVLFETAKKYIADRGLWEYNRYFKFCSRNYALKNGNCQFIIGRVLIPFYNVDGNLEYWTARSLIKDVIPKYIEVANGCNCVPKSEAIYAPELKNVVGTSALVVEGPIDCMSVSVCDIPCISIQGSQLYEKQVEKIRSLKIEPIFAFDRDKAGMKAMVKAHSIFPKARFVLAPQGMDWNAALVNLGQIGLKKHILSMITSFSRHEADVKRMEIYLRSL